MATPVDGAAKVFNKETLGVGSYGVAKCDQLPCAAKTTMFDTNDTGIYQFVERLNIQTLE